MLYIIRGAPGSGKTTLANQLLACKVVDCIFAADDWMFANDLQFDPKRLRECHDACFAATTEALLSGKRVAVHNTFINKWEYRRYTSFCQEHKIFYHIILCRGEWTSVHNVPQHIVDRMRRELQQQGH